MPTKKISSKPKRATTFKKRAAPAKRSKRVDLQAVFMEEPTVSVEAPVMTTPIEAPVVESTVTAEPVAETHLVKSQPASLPMLYPKPVDTMSRDKRRMLLWAGVGTTMALIVIGWVMTLPSLFSTRTSVDPTLQNSTQQFNTLFSNISQRLDSFNAPALNAPTNTPTNSPTVTNAPPASSPSALTPQQIELIKQKVLGAETKSPAAK